MHQFATQFTAFFVYDKKRHLFLFAKFRLQQFFFLYMACPAFKLAKISTKIIIYDHNADRPDYPISILNDTEARNE